METDREVSRIFRLPDERPLRAVLCARERPGGGVDRGESAGVEGASRAVVFETLDGSWLGSVVVYPTVRLEQLSERELHNLLRQAIETEPW
jgi:hypothetical protein